MQDFEKLGLFYLGRTTSGTGSSGQTLLLYDARDLLTHAVIVGMTGSGKTGLGTILLEEATIDGLPSIVIDPKGDMANLLLTFPELQAEDFLRWADPGEARRKNLSLEEHAAALAESWKRGLAGWGQSGERIARLRASAEFTVYTPGSESGVPVSILRSFASPGPAVLEDGEILRERILTTATGLLGLAGMEADPIRSREHILLSTILGHAWSQGRDLDLASIIQMIQSPPVSTIGVMPMETFFPAADRFRLALAINNLLAAPAFGAWMQGETLDPATLLYQADGRPRVSIFSIAHLGESERMFFVTLLLNQVVGWMRTQPGTTALRAMLYMDEIFGFFPPVANPPSKAPMLTLLKQARAYGMGIVLATQNPVDLDYKGLANTGTWFIGRLQTERDRMRVLDGLQGASGDTGRAFDRSAFDDMLGSLRSRVFLMRNVHEENPSLFETRWTMSYLRGPLARQELRQLMAGRRSPQENDDGPAETPRGHPAHPQPQPPAAPIAEHETATRPALPPDIPQYFAPVAAAGEPRTVYRPMILGNALVQFSNPRLGVEASRNVTFVTPVTSEVVPVDWNGSSEAAFALDDLARTPLAGALFESLPAVAGKPRSYESWKKGFGSWLHASQNITVLRSEAHGLVSNPDETERDFRIRVEQAARERRDEEVERLRAKYAPKLAALEEKLRRAEQAVERESQQVSQQKVQTAISLGATVLGALFGRKAAGASTVGRATTTARGIGRAAREAQDVARARETLAAIQSRIEDLDRRLKEEIDDLEHYIEASRMPFEPVPVRPKKTGITVNLVALTWVPAILSP